MYYCAHLLSTHADPHQLGLLTSAEAESVIALEFNPVRVGFHGGAGEGEHSHLARTRQHCCCTCRGKLAVSAASVRMGVCQQHCDVPLARHAHMLLQ